MAKKKKKPESKPESEPAKGEPSPASRMMRAVALLIGAGALGVAGGAVVVKELNLRDRMPGASAAGALTKGDGAALLAAAAAERTTPEAATRGALADALLVVDFGGGDEHAERLRALKKAEPAVRRAPEVLYARALFERTGVPDSTLEDDLGADEAKGKNDKKSKKGKKGKTEEKDEDGEKEEKEEKEDKQEKDEESDGDEGGKDRGDDAASAGDPSEPTALRLARATRLLDVEERREDAWAAVQGAALEPGAPAYALVAAARLALARGDARAAAVLAERGLAQSPKHGMLLALSALAVAFEPRDQEASAEDSSDDDAPKRKPKARREDKDDSGDNDDNDDKGGKSGKGGKGAKGNKGDDDDKDDKDAEDDGETKKPVRARKMSATETRIAKGLDELSPRDAAVAAWALQALALARGDDAQARSYAKKVLAEAPDSAALAARQAELYLLTGDVSAAEELIAAALKRNAGDADLLLARARVRALKVLPAEALRGDGPAAADAQSLALPLGRLVLDATAAGLPLRAALSPSVAPDERLVAARAAGSKDVEGRLAVVEQVWKAEHALMRGDVPAAAEAAAAARAKAPNDVDVLLVDASAKLLQGDRDGVKAALRAAVEGAAVEGAAADPRVLLAASRVAYDAEDFASASAWLKELQANGVRSPTALAMSAVLAARDGDSKGAQAHLKEAEAISADDTDVLRARLVLARLAGDLAEVRKQADRLLRVDNARSPDPLLRAWQGEALFRKGDAPRAQAVLQSVLAARPSMIDAHLAMGIALAGTQPQDAAASFAQVIQIGGDAPLVAEATRRRAAIKDAPPLLVAPKGKGR